MASSSSSSCQKNSTDSKKDSKIMAPSTNDMNSCSTNMNGNDKHTDLVCSLLEMMKMSSIEDIAEKLCLMSQLPLLCQQMRDYGYIKMLIQLLHRTEDRTEMDCNELRRTSKLRHDLWQALANIVHHTSNDKNEIRILKILENLHAFVEILWLRFDEDGTADTVNHPVSLVVDLHQLCSDQRTVELIELFGGIHVISEVIKCDFHCHKLNNSDCIRLQLYSLMILTHVTYQNPSVKKLLGSKRSFLLVLMELLQLSSNTKQIHQYEDLIWAVAKVLQNLSWDTNFISMQTMRDVQTVPNLTKALMHCKKESTALALMAALGNLTASSPQNKTDFCKQNGSLDYLISHLSSVDHESVVALVEAAGCILRNISSLVATDPTYRKILQKRKTSALLVEHLESGSLEVVSNACVVLAYLSSGNNGNENEDLRSMLECDAVKKLSTLKNSKHRIIREGASATYRNLVQSSIYAEFNNDGNNQKPLPTSLSFSSFPMRKMKTPVKPEVPAENGGQTAAAMSAKYNFERRVSRSSSHDSIRSTHSEPMKSSTGLMTKSANQESFGGYHQHHQREISRMTKSLWTGNHHQDDNNGISSQYDHFCGDAKCQMPNGGNTKNTARNFIQEEDSNDEPTDYSKRYKEHDEINPPRRSSASRGEQGEDSVKIYQTEDTPLAFSLAPSLSDLCDFKSVYEEDEKRRKSKPTQSTSRIQSDFDSEKTTKVLKCNTKPNVPPKPKEISNNVEDHHNPVSETPSDDSAIRFMTEDTPAIFSHATSLSSLTVDDDDDDGVTTTTETDKTATIAPPVAKRLEPVGSDAKTDEKGKNGTKQDEDDDEILKQCIDSAMPTGTSGKKSAVSAPSSRLYTPNSVRSPRTSRTARYGRGDFDHDQKRQFCVEDTPVQFSQCHSPLSALSFDEDDIEHVVVPEQAVPVPPPQEPSPEETAEVPVPDHHDQDTDQQLLEAAINLGISSRTHTRNRTKPNVTKSSVSKTTGSRGSKNNKTNSRTSPQPPPAEAPKMDAADDDDEDEKTYTICTQASRQSSAVSGQENSRAKSIPIPSARSSITNKIKITELTTEQTEEKCTSSSPLTPMTNSLLADIKPPSIIDNRSLMSSSSQCSSIDSQISDIGLDHVPVRKANSGDLAVAAAASTCAKEIQTLVASMNGGGPETSSSGMVAETVVEKPQKDDEHLSPVKSPVTYVKRKPPPPPTEPQVYESDESDTDISEVLPLDELSTPEIKNHRSPGPSSMLYNKPNIDLTATRSGDVFPPPQPETTTGNRKKIYPVSETTNHYGHQLDRLEDVEQETRYYPEQTTEQIFYPFGYPGSSRSLNRGHKFNTISVAKEDFEDKDLLLTSKNRDRFVANQALYLQNRSNVKTASKYFDRCHQQTPPPIMARTDDGQLPLPVTVNNSQTITATPKTKTEKSSLLSKLTASFSSSKDSSTSSSASVSFGNTKKSKLATFFKRSRSTHDKLDQGTSIPGSQDVGTSLTRLAPTRRSLVNHHEPPVSPAQGGPGSSNLVRSSTYDSLPINDQDLIRAIRGQPPIPPPPQYGSLNKKRSSGIAETSTTSSNFTFRTFVKSSPMTPHRPPVVIDTVPKIRSTGSGNVRHPDSNNNHNTSDGSLKIGKSPDQNRSIGGKPPSSSSSGRGKNLMTKKDSSESGNTKTTATTSRKTCLVTTV